MFCLNTIYYSWNNPSLSGEEIKNKQISNDDKNLVFERVENNVWWPWKNYDDWLIGRGLKTETKKREKKNRKDKKEKKKKRKNEKKRNKPKINKKQNVIIIEDNNKLPINRDDNEIIRKGSIPEIQYKASAIDVILKNSSLIPTLVKYTSRNYTYGIYLFTTF